MRLRELWNVEGEVSAGDDDFRLPGIVLVALSHYKKNTFSVSLSCITLVVIRLTLVLKIGFPVSDLSGKLIHFTYVEEKHTYIQMQV